MEKEHPELNRAPGEVGRTTVVGSWSKASSYSIYSAEEEYWEAEQHPDPNRTELGHVVYHDCDGVIIHCKPADGLNEPFFEVLANRLSYSLGANVTPTFTVVFNERLGTGSAGSYTNLLTQDSYESFLSWEGNTFVARHFVINVWFAHDDWSTEKYDNIAVSFSADGTLSGAYEFDKSHILFGPNGRFGEAVIHKLSTTLSIRRAFFGYEIFFNNRDEAIETVRKVELINDSEIYKTTMSVARLIGGRIPELFEYYKQLALASSHVLIARKRRLRVWIESIIALNSQPQLQTF